MGTHRWWRGYAPDAALAIAVAGLLLASTLITQRGPAGIDPLGYLLLVLAALPLAARRRFPIAVLLVSAACVAGYLVRGYPGVITAFPVLIAVYTAVRTGHRLPAIAAGVVLVPGVLAVNLVLGQRLPVVDVIQGRLLLAGWLVASGVMGEVIRQHNAYLHQVEQRAAVAERVWAEVARRRAGEERLRIARELHDSLTHSISIIKVQAGVAVHLARKRGEEVPEALLAIQDASRDAMRELRETLEVLRRTDHGAPGGGLDRLPGLLERAGIPATVTTSGQQRALPPDIDQAAYRIVQEALTNITRHAGGASAAVHIGYGSDELTVQVADDGRATPDVAVVPGVGLIGMRERVTALGGRLLAEPGPAGGFTVRAVLPVVESS